MASTQNNNPIIPRLRQLSEQWITFEELPDKSIGLWMVKPEEYRMIEVFYEVEQTEAGQVPSIFLRFSTPFHNTSVYGDALQQDLQQLFEDEDNRKSFEEAGFSADELLEVSSTTAARSWLAGLQALAEHSPALDGHVVAFLNPEENNVPEDWITWLMDLIDAGIPDKVKIMLVDLQGSSLFDPIFKYHPEAIERLETDLAMDDAVQEMAAMGGANDPEDPGIRFRQAFVSLVQSAKPGQLDTARGHADRALQIAVEQDWPDQRVAVYMAMASILLNNKKPEAAIQQYDEALTAAKRLTDPKRVWPDEREQTRHRQLGYRLIVQSLLGKGAVYTQLQQYPEAAKCYEEAAGEAKEVIALATTEEESRGDYLLVLEAWRMAGFAHEMDKNYFAAWDAGQAALTAAEQLPPENLGDTTLPFVGAALLRVATKSDNRRERGYLREKLEKMLGPDWEEKAEIKP